MLTENEIDAIYDALVHLAGAPESMRDNFRFHFPACVEYRFQGDLGFGGKVWCDGSRIWVDCSPEDRDLAAEYVIDRTNLAIAQIMQGKEDPDIERTQAWGRVKKTRSAAITDAVDALGRLAAETRRTQVGYPRYDEVRKTPTGWQARVSSLMKPSRRACE